MKRVARRNYFPRATFQALSAPAPAGPPIAGIASIDEERKYHTRGIFWFCDEAYFCPVIKIMIIYVDKFKIQTMGMSSSHQMECNKPFLIIFRTVKNVRIYAVFQHTTYLLPHANVQH